MWKIGIVVFFFGILVSFLDLNTLDLSSQSWAQASPVNQSSGPDRERSVCWSVSLLTSCFQMPQANAGLRHYNVIYVGAVSCGIYHIVISWIAHPEEHCMLKYWQHECLSRGISLFTTERACCRSTLVSLLEEEAARHQDLFSVC